MEDTDLQDQQKEARSLTIFNAREEEQQKFTNLIAPKTPDQEQEQEEAQSLTIINAREEKQQRGANLIALKTFRQEEDTKVPEETSCRRRPRA